MRVEEAPAWLRHNVGRHMAVALVLTLLYVGRAVLNTARARHDAELVGGADGSSTAAHSSRPDLFSAYRGAGAHAFVHGRRSGARHTDSEIATLDNAFAGRETFTLSAEVAAQSIARIWRTMREWKVHFEEYQVPPDQLEKIAPAFRHIDDVSTPALRKLVP